MAKPIVTYEVLEELDACEDELEAFKKVFPFGAEISQESLTRATVHSLNLEWLFDKETLIRKAGLGKITIRKGFVTLKDGLFHSFKKRPSFVKSDGKSFVTLMWHKHGKRTAYGTVDVSRNEYSFSFFGGRLGLKRKRRGLEAAFHFSQLLAEQLLARELPEENKELRASIEELRVQNIKTRQLIGTLNDRINKP